MARILLVDDELAIRKVLSLLLSDLGHDVTAVADGEHAIEAARASTFDLVILDFALPGMDGLQVLRSLLDRDPTTTCIFLTAYGSIRSAVDAIRAGAYDYVTKPFDNDELIVVIDRALEVRRLSQELSQLRSELEVRYGFDEIVGISAPMREVFRMLARMAQTDQTVLILGESGTGKELAARAIHRRSSRVKGPFLAVNCSAIPPTLIESEFFGTERGAFTDAKEARAGRFELASKGSLFLDEIGDLPQEAQAKLLRVLQEREVTRLGGSRAIAIDVRVIAATNKNLESEVAKGRFREDLYYRLDVLGLRLPPLRERSEDIPLLIDHLLDSLAKEMQMAPRSIAPEAKRLLLAHDWPGNVRELENTLRRAIVLAEGPAVRAIDLPSRIRGDATVGASVKETLTLAEAVQQATARVERGLIQAALAEHRGNRTETAESLGINRKTLFNKMKSYGLAGENDVE